MVLSDIAESILQERICTKCGEVKSLDCFRKNSSRKDKLAIWCIQCADIANKNWRKDNNKQTNENAYNHAIKKLYGITRKEYDELFEKQFGVCAVCKKEQKRKLAVDHNHLTGKVRGLLCVTCNMLLGHIENNSIRFSNLINYLEEDKNG